MVARFCSFEWIGGLPDWLQPILWSLAFLFIPTAAVVRLTSRGSVLVDLLLLVGFVVAGCATGGLLFDGMKALRHGRDQRKLERLAGFEAALKAELKNRPVKEFSFTRLVTEQRMSPAEANALASKFYRRFLDQVVADGVVTSSERRRVKLFARLLELSPEQSQFVEAEAKSAAYSDAVNQVLEDGVVTPDEWDHLQSLVSSLSVSLQDQRAAHEKIDTVTAVATSREGGIL